MELILLKGIKLLNVNFSEHNIMEEARELGKEAKEWTSFFHGYCSIYVFIFILPVKGTTLHLHIKMNMTK